MPPGGANAAVAAERAAANAPEKVPPSIWTALLSNPVSLLVEPDLGEEGRMMVASQVATLAWIVGLAEELRAEGRAQLLAEQADPKRRAYDSEQALREVQSLGSHALCAHSTPGAVAARVERGPGCPVITA